MMDLLPVEQALTRILSRVKPLPPIAVKLPQTLGLVLADDYHAKHSSPPFNVSAMDGYAVRAKDVSAKGARLDVIGQSVPGRSLPPPLQSGQAARIFTGAPMPEASDSILIQENAQFDRQSMTIIAIQPVSLGLYVRPKGNDFTRGECLLTKQMVMDPARIALASAMDYDRLTVIPAPKIAIIASGDELRYPGEPAADNRYVVSSNSYGIGALAQECGVEYTDYGIVRDDKACLRATIEQAIGEGCNAVVISGGSSVGDYDYTDLVLGELGFAIDFSKIAMRPGKPLIYGYRDQIHAIGLPGNPVSALVCAIVFLVPMFKALAGHNSQGHLTQTALLQGRCPPTGERQEYLRATLDYDRDGRLLAIPFPNQDSAMLADMAKAGGLIIRPPRSPETIGGSCQIIKLRRR